MATILNRTTRLPSQEVLLSLLRYDPGTGLMFWRVRPKESFTRERDWLNWTSRYADREAFPISSNGYRQGTLDKKTVAAHRVAWKMLTGDEPAAIDHINGDRSDNRISNLRAVTNGENSKNAARYRSNLSGISGVRWHNQRQKWQAYIRSGKLRHLGYFSKIEDAFAARKAAEAELSFHPNNGRDPFKSKGT